MPRMILSYVARAQGRKRSSLSKRAKYSPEAWDAPLLRQLPVLAAALPDDLDSISVRFKHVLCSIAGAIVTTMSFVVCEGLRQN